MSETTLVRYESAESLRRAILMASAQACSITVTDLLGGSTSKARNGRKVAFYLARKVMAFKPDVAASMLGLSPAQAMSIERSLRMPRIWNRLSPEIQVATKLLASVRFDTNRYEGQDTHHAICSIPIRAMLSEVHWLLAHASTILDKIYRAYELILKREERLTVLDRLIAAGWGDHPYSEIPEQVIAAAEQNLPVPAQSKMMRPEKV